MSKNRRAGTIYFKTNGKQHDAKGSFTYNLGGEKRETIVGADGVHGYSATPMAAFIEGTISDGKDVDVAALKEIDGETATLELANGKTVILREAWYVADGDVTTEQGEIQIRLEGLSGEEMS